MNGLRTVIEMALRQRSRCAWVVSVEHNGLIVGVDQGQPFAIAMVDGAGLPPVDQQRGIQRWARAGARVGTARSIKDALAILNGADHAR